MSRRAIAGVCAIGLALAGCRTVDPWADLYDPEMGWRAKAAAGLGDMATAEDVDNASYALAQAWMHETVPLVRYAIATAFGRLGTDRAAPIAAEALGDADPMVRAAGARALGRLRSLTHVALLLRQLKAEETPSVRAAIVEAFADLDDRDETLRLDEVATLITHLDDEPEVSLAAHDALVRLTQQPLPRNREAWEDWWDRWRASAPRGD